MDSEKKLLTVDKDYLVCTCMGVMYSDICDALNKGCKTFDDLSDTLLVGTGCTSCVEEIEQIVADKVKK